MKKDDRAPGAYVRRVGEDMRRYAREVLDENERLRALVASLESERVRLEEKLRTTEQRLKEHEVYRGLVTTIEAEKLRLQDQLLAVRDELERYQLDHSRLQQRLASVEKDNRRFSEQFFEVEIQNSNLVNLYVASYRLHGTLDRREVLEIIQEIIANLVGCEQLAILEINPERTALVLGAAFGIDPGPYQTIPLGSGLIGRTAETGETFIAEWPPAPGGRVERPASEAELTACVPLKLNDRVTGALALFRLLPQKTSGLQAVDRELFDLLATHAANALYCTALHARLGAETGVGR